MVKYWYQIFLLGIFLIIVVRAVFILTGRAEKEDKVSKVTNLVLGMILVTFSWALIGVIFNQKIGDFGWFSSSSNDKGLIEVETKDYNEDLTNDTTIQLKIKIGADEDE